MRISFSKPAYTENGNQYRKTRFGTAVARVCTGYAAIEALELAYHQVKNGNARKVTQNIFTKAKNVKMPNRETISNLIKGIKNIKINKETFENLANNVKSKINKESFKKAVDNLTEFAKKQSLKEKSGIFVSLAVAAATALTIQAIVNKVRANKADKNA